MTETNSRIDAILKPIDEASPYPEELAGKEERNGRRARVGFALSGGGIRSATLSLGFFQGLAALGVLKYVDILSTVSGGGYFGGFYGHLVQREADKKRAKEPPEPVGREIADEVLKDAGAPWVKFLRDNGRYLSPNGAGDLFAAASVALRNWFAVIFVLGTFALFVLTSLALFRLGVEQRLTELMSLQMSWPVAWLSPWFLIVAAALPALAVPPGWAYWLVRDNPPYHGLKPWLARWAAPVGFVGFALYLLVPRLREWRDWSFAYWSLAVLAVTALLTVGRFLVGRWSKADKQKGQQTQLSRGFLRHWIKVNEPEVQRTHLSRGFARALTSLIVLLLIATFDSLGLAIVWFWNSGLLAATGGAAAVFGIFRKPLMNFVTGLGSKERPRISTELLALAASVVLVLITVGGVASIPYFVAYGGGALPVVHPASLSQAAYMRLLWLASLTLLVALATAILRPFVNRSSLHALYESRLRRAYMGATNPARLGEGVSFPAMSAPHKDDAIAWRHYDPSRHGGPLHLINVTVNETVHGRSQVEQRDRKGLAMAIGPAGVSVGRKHHALWQYQSLGSFAERMAKDGKKAMNFLSGAFSKKDAVGPQTFRIFPSVARPELLDVAQWLAISGGAVSTGLGSRTSPSLSVLLGFFNVRLGYWWRSGVRVDDRQGATGLSHPQRVLNWVGRRFPVQMSLLDEWSARFPGIARTDWYLTDGGHFENLGAYELVRRRLPLIIVCDFEADPKYAYGGLGNLVRKARIDFGTEITFLSEEQVRGNDPLMPLPFHLPKCVGTLEALRRGHRSAESVKPAGGEEARQTNDGAPDGFSLVHGALAHVQYPHVAGAAVKEGWLLYVKASLDGDEPADVLQYHTDNPVFPQQSTADQFFDESQWESYRCLGEHMASEVFAEKSLREWMPGRATQ